MAPPKNNRNHTRVLISQKLVTNGTGIAERQPNKQQIELKGSAAFDSYPPTVCIKYPPKIHPVVGAVIETTEKTMLTL